MGYGMDGPGFDPVGARDYSFLQNVQTESWADPASYSVGNGIFSTGKAARALKTTRVRLEPRLGMSGPVPLLPHIPSWRGRGEKLPFTVSSTPRF